MGATFYHLATGRRMRDYRDQIDYDLLVSRTSEAFAQIIAKAVEKDPNKRFNSAFEMFQAFQKCGEEGREIPGAFETSDGCKDCAFCLYGRIYRDGGIGDPYHPGGADG